MQLCESWGDLERELQAIVTDSAMPKTVKKSCAWGALALAVGLAEKKAQEHREKVKMMQDQVDEQKLLINALLGMVQKQRVKHQIAEKGVDEYKLHKGFRDFNRVEGKEDFFPSNPVSEISTQYENQEDDEEEGDEIYALNNFVLCGDEGYDATETEPLTESGHDDEEKNEVPVKENRNEVNNFSDPEMQKAWSQACPLKPHSLSSSSEQPRFVSQVAAEEGEQIFSVPTVHCSPASWRSRQYHSRKMLSEKFRLRSNNSYYKKRGIIRRAGDWYCDECNVMNFSWRNVCFRCKQFQTTKVIEDFLHNWRFR
ncbi:Zinc finger, RanBP2-type containing protein [Cricetulus griseus]|uniref:Zinc finger, RanBP2-type containing protein n=1 Tax=Cricetulus griseus TaxID=10029 RepID=A0A061HU81_CRIGR|nr:Zinc finger, RanBP2-type containing protein [Cricetulus griseus]